MKRRDFLAILISQSGLILLPTPGLDFAWASDRPYTRIVVLGDPHVPGKHLEVKERALRTINTWTDADLVVAMGDLCQDLGTEAEYAEVKRFFGILTQPLKAIPGNHDFIYADAKGPDGKRVRAAPELRDAKLKRFMDTFGLKSLYSSTTLGGYLLVFLSPERSEHLTEMSEQQLAWFDSLLESNKDRPAIVFFHGPLAGTLRDYKPHVNAPNFVAQPAQAIHDILARNPQAFLWVSGHTHTPPSEESFASAVNVYDNRVTDIHNTDMGRGTVWTNSLYLYPGKVVVKTFNHDTNDWMPQFERTLKAPT